MTVHSIPTEQHTNAHNTFSETLTAIVAHQVMVHKQGFLRWPDRRHCMHRISLPTMLKESEDIPLRDTKRFASYQRLACKSYSKGWNSTHIISSTSALLKKTKNDRLIWPCTNASK